METEAGSVISLVNYLNGVTGKYGPLMQATYWFGSLMVAGIITIPGYFFLRRLYHKLFSQLLNRVDSLLEENVQLKRQLAEQKTEFQSKVRIKNKDLRDLKKEHGVVVGKLERARDAFRDDERHSWRRKPFHPPENYHAKMHKSKPVILLANMKGGVGKTTIASNLVGYFTREHNERVLAIDLDYQGSLSHMLARFENEQDHIPTNYLIDGRASADEILSYSLPIRSDQNDSRILWSLPPFSNFENALMLEWLIGDREDDIRYNLARFIHSDFIQSKFDRVIIDAPPRFSTGFVNALCASTHVFIPTILDRTSADGVSTFLLDLQKMRGELFPELKTSGIIGSMKTTNGGLTTAEQQTVLDLKRRLPRMGYHENLLLEDAYIPRNSQIAQHAGTGIAYWNAAAVRSIFKPLGDIVHQRTTHIGGYDGNTHPHAPAPSV